jgi:hypothetical protein
VVFSDRIPDRARQSNEFLEPTNLDDVLLEEPAKLPPFRLARYTPVRPEYRLGYAWNVEILLLSW